MTNEKTLRHVQQEVDDYIGQFKEGYFSPLAMMARLTEELGELAREVNHYYGEKPKKTTETEKRVSQVSCAFKSKKRKSIKFSFNPFSHLAVREERV